MNTHPCQTCRYYDNILQGTRPTRNGLCALKSVYPAFDTPGQVTPAGVTRAAPGAPGKPVIVRGDVVQASCTDHSPLPRAATRAELLALAKRGTSGGKQ